MRVQVTTRAASAGIQMPGCLVRWISSCVVGAATVTVLGAEGGERATVAIKNEAPPAVSRPVAKAAAAKGKAPTATPPSAPRTASSGRIALAADPALARPVARTDSAPVAAPAPAVDAELSPTARALRIIAECQTRYQNVKDYTCTFYKRERIDGRLTDLHVMRMKVRTQPRSIYLKFEQPAQGREAIYIAGRNAGKILAHDVGFTKLLAGTISLDPTSARAMEDCRHPITEAGIGPLLDALSHSWEQELNPEESVLTFRDDAFVGARRCLMIESTHPEHRQNFLYHKVRVFIDEGVGLPIRFEAYDWPDRARNVADLAEEYSYMNLKLNVGLRDIDFDTANPEYSFGHF